MGSATDPADIDRATILVATDFSDAAQAAARWAAGYGAEHDLAVIVAHVVTISVGHWAEGAYDVLDDPDTLAKAEQKVANWYTEATGDTAEHIDIRVGHAAVQLREAAGAHAPALMVVARSGKAPWETLLLGSTAQALAVGAPCPLAIVPPTAAAFEADPEIAVGTDFSSNCRHAAIFSANLCRAFAGRLHVVHVDQSTAVDIIDTPDMPLHYVSGHHVEWATEQMDALVETLGDALDAIDYHTHIIEDDPARGLIDFVQTHDIDVLVVGRSGHFGDQPTLINQVLGGVLLKVLQKNPAATLVIPAIDPDHTDTSQTDTH